MKKRLLLIVVIVIVLSVLFAGCSREIKYGTWKLSQTGNPDTGQFEDFMFPITIRVDKDGTVYMLDTEFGIVTEDRQNYHFEQTSDLGDTKIVQDGAWEIIINKENGSIELYVYPDTQKIVYKLIRLADPEDEE